MNQPHRHRYLVPSLAAIALVSIACAAVAAFFARDLYQRWAAVKLRPTYESYFAEANRNLATSTGTRVVLFGDSRMVRWNPLPAAPGFEMVARGVAGETTAQMRYRFKADALDLRPSVIVLQAGINDLVAGTVIGRDAEALENVVSNLTEFTVAAEASGIRVIVMTVVRPARPPLWRRLAWSDSIIQRVEAANRRLAALARPGVQILDADTVLAGSARYLPSGYSVDTLHFNQPAYEVLSAELLRLLQENSNAVQQ